MGKPLTPTSSQEIIPISPPPSYKNKLGSSSNHNHASSSSVTLPKPKTFVPSRDLREKIVDHVKEYERKVEVQSGKRKAKSCEMEEERERVRKLSRSQVTERMMSTLKNEINPITHSDLYFRSDHIVSAATGHQVSNRGGGSSGEATYWQVRTAKMADQARPKQSDLFKGCVFYINGSTGPKISNLQLQNLINQNGGRFTPHQSSGNTHIIASGGLSGSKTQKWINGQAGRGAAKHMKVIRVDWLIDCVEKGRRLPETTYGVIEDPSQKNLFSAFGVKPRDV